MANNYEIHFTVGYCELDHFKRYCGDLCLKPLLIDLQHSEETIDRHLMASKRIYGSHADVMAAIFTATQFFSVRAIDIVRVKVETDTSNPLLSLERPLYWEVHIPVEIYNGESSVEFDQCATMNDWHKSRNAFKNFADFSVYFYTFRSTVEGHVFAAREAMIKRIAQYNFTIHVNKIETEAVLLDTAQSLDDKWINSNAQN